MLKKTFGFMKKLNTAKLVFSSIILIISTGQSYSNGLSDSIVSDISKFCSRMHGFNLLGKFDVYNSNTGYVEKEFYLIQQFGFNFARLPLDFRTYTVAGDWNSFKETEVQQIDKAIAWGIKYNIHICINIHRAPGYCVNSTTLPLNQQLNLWTDTVAQNAFIKHWTYFAVRYKDISPDKLSFNLVNEPSNVSESDYSKVMLKAIKAIHAVTPSRIIFVDGLNYATTPVVSLKDEPNIAQAIHCYSPFGITHYKAEWISGSNDMPLPHWPLLQISNYLYGPWKAGFKSTLVINGTFPKETEVIVNVKQVSIESTLLIKSGTNVVLSKKFVCTADTGQDFSKIISTQYGYQNISNKNFSGKTVVDASRLTFENSSGDWMIINSITIKTDGSEYTFFPGDDTWGNKQDTVIMDASGKLKAKDGSDLIPFQSYRSIFATAKSNNIPIMIQEFGVYNKTPHDVSLSFLSDIVKLFNENNLGWAMWNFNGAFGILNSGRADCVYENYQGYKLDRALLDIITGKSSTEIIAVSGVKGLKIYPNPAKGYIYISGNNLSGKLIIKLTDITGKTIKIVSFKAEDSGLLKLELSDVLPGVYIVSLKSIGVNYYSKIIVRQ